MNKAIEQVVEMLRSYNREPKDIDIDCSTEIQEAYWTVQANMATTIFTEMLQYVSEEKKAELVEQFSRER